MKHLCYGILLLLAGFLSGCHGQPIVNDQAKPLHPVKSTLQAANLFTPIEGKRIFTVTEGSHQGQTWHLQDSTPKDHAWQSLMTGQFVIYYRLTSDGNIVIEQEDDFESAAQVVYDPPMVMLPAYLATHVPKWTTVKMTVTTLNGKMVRDQGHCRYQVQVLGRDDRGVVIRMTRELQLRFAQGRVTLDYVFKEGLGLIAQRTEKNLTILGILPQKSIEAFEVSP